MIHERIKQVRKAVGEQGKTQDSFANCLGISKQNLSSYEIGRRTPSDAVIRLICDKFNVNESWLRTGNGEMFVEKTTDEEIATFIGRIQMNDTNNFKKRFISALSKLDESEWAVLEKLALEMSEKKD